MVVSFNKKKIEHDISFDTDNVYSDGMSKTEIIDQFRIRGKYQSGNAILVVKSLLARLIVRFK